MFKNIVALESKLHPLDVKKKTIKKESISNGLTPTIIMTKENYKIVWNVLFTSFDC